MIIVGDKVYRNIQEQVAKNKEDIEDLQQGIVADCYTKEEADAKFETKEEAEEALDLKADKSTTYTKEEVNTLKQDTLVSGTNLKTINDISLLGNGNIEIPSGYHLYQIEIVEEQSDILYKGVFIVASPNNLNTGNYTREQLYNNFGYLSVRGSGSAVNRNNEILRVSPSLELTTSDITLIFIYYDNVEQDWQDYTINFDSARLRKIF